MFTSHWHVFIILIAGMAGSIWLQKLTPIAAATGGIIGFFIYWGTGYTGLLMMALFFIAGTLATAWHKNEKESKRLSDKDDSQRTAAQVLANAGLAGLLALCSFLHPDGVVLYTLLLAAVFSSATADTLSSELGNVYGKRFYHILTFKRDTKGLDGVISLEGTLAGLCGSMMIALVYSLIERFQISHFFILIIAGTVGNIADSVLGATVERNGILGNNMVNFLNTLSAAIVAAGLYLIFAR